MKKCEDISKGVMSAIVWPSAISGIWPRGDIARLADLFPFELQEGEEGWGRKNGGGKVMLAEIALKCLGSCRD